MLLPVRHGCHSLEPRGRLHCRDLLLRAGGGRKGRRQGRRGLPWDEPSTAAEAERSCSTNSTAPGDDHPKSLKATCQFNSRFTPRGTYRYRAVRARAILPARPRINTHHRQDINNFQLAEKPAPCATGASSAPMNTQPANATETQPQR